MLEQVWGVHEDTDTRAIDNFIVRLRRYIEENPPQPRHLQTVRGVGYRFVPRTPIKAHPNTDAEPRSLLQRNSCRPRDCTRALPEVGDAAARLSARARRSKLLALDEPFPDPAALIVIPDHYIVRMLYSQGVAMEHLGIPRTDGARSNAIRAGSGNCSAIISICSAERRAAPGFGRSSRMSSASPRR